MSRLFKFQNLISNFLIIIFYLENPRPEHGPLITIKLNESEEMLTSSSGQQHKVLSELFFQMNYDTGEYKKIKKMKPIVLNT
jgi:hypothetical protein